MRWAKKGLTHVSLSRVYTNFLIWMIIRNANSLSKKWAQLAEYKNENICNANKLRNDPFEMFDVNILNALISDIYNYFSGTKVNKVKLSCSLSKTFKLVS